MYTDLGRMGGDIRKIYVPLEKGNQICQHGETSISIGSQNSEQMKQILTILRMFGEGLTKYRGIACLTEIKKQEEVIPLKNS